MPRPSSFSIAPEDKRSVAVTLKLTERENELLAKYATQLDSDKSYVAGKIFEAVIPQALTSQTSEAEIPVRVNGTGKKHSEKLSVPATA
jgi:hypothetical protein